jgi:hypothetical protein
VFDFSAVSDQLPPRQRSTIMQQTRAIFTEARVNNVRVFTKGQKIPSVKGKHHVTTLKFEKIVKKADGSPVLGKTNAFMDTTPFQPNKGHVSTTRGGLQGDAMLIQLSNTSGHEIGHTLGLYPFDGVGSETPAPAGSVMETGVPASALGQELRYFSAEEAEYLRDLLNEPGETAFYFSHEGN